MLWEHADPLTAYRAIRSHVISHAPLYDMCNELQSIDLFLMHRGDAGKMIWARQIFMATGLKNWFRGGTPSNNKSLAMYRPYLPRMIAIPVHHIDDFQGPEIAPPKIAVNGPLDMSGLPLHVAKILQPFAELSQYESCYQYVLQEHQNHSLSEEDLKTLESCGIEQAQQLAELWRMI